jgi:hypothetical protein
MDIDTKAIREKYSESQTVDFGYGMPSMSDCEQITDLCDALDTARAENKKMREALAEIAKARIFTADMAGSNMAAGYQMASVIAQEALEQTP